MYKYFPLTAKDSVEVFKSKNPRLIYTRKQIEKADQKIEYYEGFKKFIKKV